MLKMIAIILLLLGSTLVSGCARQATDMDIPEPPTPAASDTRRLNLPNYFGDWGAVPGEFLVYRVKSDVKVVNTTNGRDIPPTRCMAPFVYKLNEDNDTLTIARHHVAHPTEPGPLRVAYLNEATLYKCNYRHLFMINEGVQPNNWCERGYQLSGMEPGDWHCSVSVDYSSRWGLLWEHLSFDFDDQGNVVSLVFNNETIPGNVRVQRDISLFVAEKPWIKISANVTLEPLHRWPYSAILRD